MDLGQLSKTINAINDPGKAMIEWLQAGNVFVDERQIADGEKMIKRLEYRIEANQEGFERQYFHMPQFPKSEDGLRLIEKIKKLEGWVKVIKKAIKEGKEAIGRSERVIKRSNAEKAGQMARDNYKKAKVDDKLVNLLFEIAEGLGGKTILEFFEPVMKARRLLRISLRNVKENGGEITDLPPLAEDSLEESIEKLVGMKHQKNGWITTKKYL